MIKENKVGTIARALAMGGINASHSAVELILGIIFLVEDKGEEITLKDVTELSAKITKEAEEKVKAELKVDADK